MADVKADVMNALNSHAHVIDDLHRKLAALPGCDQQRLAKAVAKFKSAHQEFQDDALGCVGF